MTGRPRLLLSCGSTPKDALPSAWENWAGGGGARQPRKGKASVQVRLDRTSPTATARLQVTVRNVSSEGTAPPQGQFSSGEGGGTLSGSLHSKLPAYPLGTLGRDGTRDPHPTNHTPHVAPRQGHSPAPEDP